LEQITSSGSKVITSGLNDPVGVAVSALGKVYVAQYGNGTIALIDTSNGNITPIAYGLTGISAITADSYGGLFAVEKPSGELLSVTAQGKTAVVVRGLHAPSGVAQDAYGHVNTTLQGQGSGKGELWQITFGGKAEVLVTGLDNPGQVATDANGDTFFIESGTNRVWEDRGLLGAQILWEGHGPTTDPSAIAVAPNGDVVVFPKVPNVAIHVSLTTSFYPV
jgi:DNA-binding beta-propeller fold protein YncE